MKAFLQLTGLNTNWFLAHYKFIVYLLI